MTSNAMIIPENTDCFFIDCLNNYFVWRYIKEEHRENDSEVSSICFHLTPIDKGHISFSHSNEKTIDKMIAKIHKSIKVGGKTKPALYLSIDIKEAYEEINTPKTILTFKTCGYPHIGMYYLDYENLIERNLIIASLVELSNTYFRADGGIVTKVD